MDTKSTILGIAILIAVFFGFRYWHQQGADMALVELGEEKLYQWRHVAGGVLQYPTVEVSVINPPFEGAVLQLRGSVPDASGVIEIKDWLENIEPELTPEEYILEVEAQPIAAAPAPLPNPELGFYDLPGLPAATTGAATDWQPRGAAANRGGYPEQGTPAYGGSPGTPTPGTRPPDAFQPQFGSGDVPGYGGPPSAAQPFPPPAGGLRANSRSRTAVKPFIDNNIIAGSEETNPEQKKSPLVDILRGY